MFNRRSPYLLIVLTLMFAGCFITGRVINVNEAGVTVGVADVTVTLSGDSLPEARETTTDSDGYYIFGDLAAGDIIPAGKYTLTPSKLEDNFTPTSTDVIITTARIQDLDDVPMPVGGVNFSVLAEGSKILFKKKVDYPAGGGPSSVAMGDFDGDGAQDLASANTESANVSVLLGNGDGTFQGAINYASGGDNPISVAIEDLNGDGKPDLAVTNSAGVEANSANVSVLLGNGDGTFSNAVGYGAGTNPSRLAIEDFNGDSKPDLVVTDFYGKDYYGAGVSVLLGNGDGTFRSAVAYSAGEFPYSVAAKDLNGDSIPDLAVANYGSDNVSILLGNGNGTFQGAVNYGVGEFPTLVAAGNLNGDSAQDLAVANYGSANVSVLMGNGDGTFRAAVNYDSSGGPNALCIGNFDGDAAQDLAVANYNSNYISVLLGNAGGTFQGSVNYGSGVRPSSVATGDLNGDGAPDLGVSNYDSDNVSVLINVGQSGP